MAGPIRFFEGERGGTYRLYPQPDTQLPPIKINTHQLNLHQRHLKNERQNIIQSASRYTPPSISPPVFFRDRAEGLQEKNKCRCKVSNQSQCSQQVTPSINPEPEMLSSVGRPPIQTSKGPREARQSHTRWVGFVIEQSFSETEERDQIVVLRKVQQKGPVEGSRVEPSRAEQSRAGGRHSCQSDSL